MSKPGSVRCWEPVTRLILPVLFIVCLHWMSHLSEAPPGTSPAGKALGKRRGREIKKADAFILFFFGADSKLVIILRPERPKSQTAGMMECLVYVKSCSQRGRGATDKHSPLPISSQELHLGPKLRTPAAPQPRRLLPEHARHSCLLHLAFAHKVPPGRQASPRTPHAPPPAQTHPPPIASLKSAIAPPDLLCVPCPSVISRIIFCLANCSQWLGNDFCPTFSFLLYCPLRAEHVILCTCKNSAHSSGKTNGFVNPITTTYRCSSTDPGLLSQ